MLARLSAAIRLFYHELGVLRFQELDYLTLLNKTFVTTLDYHPLFSCKHPVSRAHLEEYENVKAHLRPASRQQTSAITVKRPPSPKEFQLKLDDFPELLKRPS